MTGEAAFVNALRKAGMCRMRLSNACDVSIRFVTGARAAVKDGKGQTPLHLSTIPDTHACDASHFRLDLVVIQ